MNPISIIDHHFDKNITTSYFLSIQLSLDGFSFCILDPVSNEYIQLYDRHLSFNETLFEVLAEELETNTYLSLKFQKIFIVYYTYQNTLIPDALYSESDEKSILDFCMQKKSLNPTVTFHHKIRMADSYCVFQIPKKIVDLINQKLGKVFYFCQTIPYIEAALLKTMNDQKTHQLHINIQNSHFEVLVTYGNNLKMHNVFNFHNSKEFLYYTLYIFEQLKLDPVHSKILLTGKISKTDELYSLLKKYIKHIEIENETNHFKFSGVFKPIQIQNFLNLFNIPLCV